ncbi:hypothetical protein BASA81_008686 [Batrachochytrium salamandrivorans]|nr:hypothetical protein BASA81_008686 [Batrachochytrium salamandrivorans]
MSLEWGPDLARECDVVDSALSSSLEKHRNQGGIIRVLRDSHTKRFFATLDVARVSQLDANLLDEELVKLGREGVQRTLKLLGLDQPGGGIDFGLRVLLWWFYMRVNLPSPGQALQNLRYRDESLFSKQPSTRGVLTLLQGDLPTRMQRVGHLLLAVVLPFAFNRFREKLVETQDFVNEQRLDYVDKLLHFARLVNFLLFLVDGRYRSVVDRVLKMRLVPIKNECVRSVSFELMNQQLLFDGFTQFVLVVFPLVDWNQLFRWGARAKHLLVQYLFPASLLRSQAEAVDEETCAYCQHRVVMPHRSLPCRHVYCYFCIKSISNSSAACSCTSCEQHIAQVVRI